MTRTAQVPYLVSVGPKVDRADFIAVRPGAGAKPPPPIRGNLFAPEPRVAVRPGPAGVPRDPKQAAVVHVSAARAAFAAGEFGRAAERLAETIAADPNLALPHFLLARVRTARGEYAEAVAALGDGGEASSRLADLRVPGAGTVRP